MSATSESSDLLCAALLKVRAKAAGLLPASWGTLVQGAWLRWVAEVAPWLSEQLHTENQERPFTCSALWLPDRPAQVRLQEAGKRLAVQQGQVCWLRLTLLDGALFGLFARQALAAAEDVAGRAALPPLTLNGIPFDLLEMVVDDRSGAGEASWSGWTSYAKLLAESRARPVRRLERLTLEFDMPTAFTGEHQPWGRETIVLPEPLRVFGGWHGAGSALPQRDWLRLSSRRRSWAIWSSACASRSTRCIRNGCICAKPCCLALWEAARICCRRMARQITCAARCIC